MIIILHELSDQGKVFEIVGECQFALLNGQTYRFVRYTLKCLTATYVAIVRHKGLFFKFSGWKHILFVQTI